MGDIIETEVKLRKRFLHHTVAAFAGFLGAYAILLRSDFFGNAQTSNLIYLMFAIVGCNFKEILIRVGGLAIYLSATLIYVYVDRKIRRDVRIFSLLVNAVAIILLALMPSDINPIIGLYPIFFAMPLQWSSFPGVYGYASSSIFSTNNTRQVALSFGEFLVDGDRKHLHKTVFFLGSLIGFNFGAAMGYIATKNYLQQAVWFDFIFLVAAAVQLVFVIRKS